MTNVKPLRIGIVVGEASGDILGAGLMQAILQRYPDTVFEGIGGERMLALGFNSFFAQERLAVMGLIEPLKRLPELLRIRKSLIKHFIANPPDVFIGIDAPDFNLTLEEKLKEAGIPTAHYVSPSVWAWRQKRIIKIARSVDLMLTLLPFEAAFYEQHQVPVVFVGHPLANEIPLQVDQQQARESLGLAVEGKLVALMPGSRGGEVNMLGQIFWQTAQWLLVRQPGLRFVVPAANPARRQQIEAQLAELAATNSPATNELPLTIIDGNSHQVMAAADMVLMASGTTTLEAMLLKRPMVVAYKFSALTFAIVSRLVKSKFFSLPNLLADKPLVPEMLQQQVTPENLGQALLGFIEDEKATAAVVGQFEALHLQLRCDANERAAQAVLQLIGRNQQPSSTDE